MLKKSLSLFIVGICSTSIFANTPATKELILSKVESGSLRMESSLMPLLDGAQEEFISMYSSRQKMTFPEFQRDFLYIKYTYDSNYEYRFFWDFQNKKCLYENTPRNHGKVAKECMKAQFDCIGKLPKTSSQGDVINCMNNQKCTSVSRNKIKIEEIDKKYCEKIYNKKL